MTTYDDIITAVMAAQAEHALTLLDLEARDVTIAERDVTILELEKALAECEDPDPDPDPDPPKVGWDSTIENTEDNPTPTITINAPATASEINQQAQQAGAGAAIEFIGAFDISGTLKPLQGQTWFGPKSTREGPKGAIFLRSGSENRCFDLKNPKTEDVTLSDIEITGFTNGNDGSHQGDGVGVVMWKGTTLRRLNLHHNQLKAIGIGFDVQPDFFAVIDSCWIHHNGYRGGLGYHSGGYKGVGAGRPFAEPGNAYTYRNCLVEENIGSGLWDDHGSSGALIENCMSRNNDSDGFKWELCNGYALWRNCTATGNSQGWSIVSSAYAELQLCHSYDNNDDIQAIEAWRSKNHMHTDMPIEDIHIGSFQNGLYLEDIKILGCKYDTIQRTQPGNLNHPDAITIDDEWTP